MSRTKAIRGSLNILMNQFADADGVTKALLSNRNPMPITGKEIINAVQVRGLASMATGALIGGGHAALIGDSMFEGAMRGAFIGGSVGAFSYMNARRARAARALGVDSRGIGGGFRAMAEISEMPLNVRGEWAERARAQFQERAQNLNRLLDRLDAENLTGRDARRLMGEIRAAAEQVAEYAPTPEAHRVFTRDVERHIDDIAQQFR